MTGSKLLLAAAIALPIAAFNLPAFAATAHNSQTGANTANSNDGGMMAKPMPMKKMHKKHMMKKKM